MDEVDLGLVNAFSIVSDGKQDQVVDGDAVLADNPAFVGRRGLHASALGTASYAITCEDATRRLTSNMRVYSSNTALATSPRVARPRNGTLTTASSPLYPGHYPCICQRRP